MILKDLQEKRAKLMADASAIVAATDVTVEQRSAFDAMLVDVATVDGDISRLEAVAQYQTEQRSAVNQPRPTPGESSDPTERAEVRNARTKASFRNYLLNGTIETRDLTVANSGVTIPQAFDAQVIEAQKSYGQIYDLVNVLKTDSGNPMKMVLDNDTANGLVSMTIGTNAASVDPTLSGVILNVGDYTSGVVRVSNGLLQDAGFDMDSFIRDKFAKRFFRGASNLICAGDAAATASLTTAYATGGITTATVNKLAYADFASAIGVLDPAYQTNAVWAMSNATLGYVLGLTDTASRPLFLSYDNGAASGFVGSILGRPVKLVTQLPAVATGAIPVLFGDFKAAYTFRQVNPGMGILRLNEAFAIAGETGFVGFSRVGGISTNAGVPPIVSITIK